MPVVKFYANLRKLTGTKEMRISASTLEETLSDLIRLFPSLKEALLDGADIRKHVVITLNGINTVDLKAATTEDDLVAIFPPIAGG